MSKRDATAETPQEKKVPLVGKIKLLVKENPKRVGTKAHGRFKLYRDGMTTAEFLEAGEERVDLNWDTKHKFIEVVPS